MNIEKRIEKLEEQLRLTNLAVKELAEMVEDGSWNGAQKRVVDIMLGQDQVITS